MRKVIVSKFLLLVIIISVGAFLRLFKLSEYPIQLNHDEVSQIYDVESIVQTGKDIYGNFMPLVFPSIGDYKVGHYIYITTLFYLIFGNNEITIRMPAAFFGSLTVIAAFLFIHSLTRNFKLGLLSAFLVAITPSEIFYSRKSFEGEVGIFLILTGLFCVVKFLNKFRMIWGFLAAIFLAASMYIYTSFTLVTPLIIGSVILIYRREKNMVSKKVVVPLLLWLVILMPLGYITITQPEVRFRPATVFITQDVNLIRQLNYSQNSVKTFIDFVTQKYLNQFNPVYIFVNGLDFTDQGFLGMGPLYFWQLPFFILGIVSLIKMNDFDKQKKILFALSTISMIPSAITFENYSPHRAMLAFVILSIISAFGLYYFLNFLINFEILKIWKFFALTLLCGSILLNFIYFVQMYTVHYPYEKSYKLQYPFKQVAQFAWSQYKDFDSIVFDPYFGYVAPMTGVGAHYYLAYYGNYDPRQFQKEYHEDKQKGEISFDKFKIRKVNWQLDQNLKNTLIIASQWSLPIESQDKEKVLKRFNFYNGQGAFYAIKL